MYISLSCCVIGNISVRHSVGWELENSVRCSIYEDTFERSGVHGSRRDGNVSFLAGRTI